jgi:hypothetical protein
MTGRPAPRYAAIGAVLVSTRRMRTYVAGTSYTPEMQLMMPMVLTNGPVGARYAPRFASMSKRMPTMRPAASSASSPCDRTSRACSSARNTSERLPVHLTGRPSALAAKSAAQYSG